MVFKFWTGYLCTKSANACVCRCCYRWSTAMYSRLVFMFGFFKPQKKYINAANVVRKKEYKVMTITVSFIYLFNIHISNCYYWKFQICFILHANIPNEQFRDMATHIPTFISNVTIVVGQGFNVQILIISLLKRWFLFEFRLFSFMWIYTCCNFVSTVSFNLILNCC